MSAGIVSEAIEQVVNIRTDIIVLWQATKAHNCFTCGFPLWHVFLPNLIKIG